MATTISTMGDLIPIEERHPSELYQIGDTITCPLSIEFYQHLM